MQDRAVVAAIVAGDPDGIAAAYDQYGASLYAYCHSLLPGPRAAEAVRDTFMIAVGRLDGLRDHDRLGDWLHAVARNECLRTLGPAGAEAATPAPGAADPDDEPAVTMPVELRGQVLTACTDNSPAGRAQRMSVAHRAGAFGPAGFPKATGLTGPRWWQRVRRHPRAVAAAAVVAALVMVTGITMTMTAGGARRPQAATLGAGGGAAGSASSAAPSSASPASSPAHQASPSASPSTPAATMPQGAPSPGMPTPPPMPSGSPPSGPPPPPSPSAPPSPSPAPGQGYLLLAPDRLLLTSASGKPASGFFVITAANGPVNQYTVKVPAGVAGMVTASPSKGSLQANGYAEVTVTVTSKTALTAHLTVDPGNLIVTVVYKIKA